MIRCYQTEYLTDHESPFKTNHGVVIKVRRTMNFKKSK